MKNHSRHLITRIAVCLLAFAGSAMGVINPALQPRDLFERYAVVVALMVASVDEAKHLVVLNVVQVFKGAYTAKQVTLSVGKEGLETALQRFSTPGRCIIAFIGQANQRGKNQIITYSGGGEWESGSKDAADPAKLAWNTMISPMDENAGMSGIFNGAVERLGDLMADRAREVDYFPAEPCDQFANDLVVGTFAKPIRGVALYDFAGSGRPGIYACSDGGDRIYLQTGPMKFTDATAKMGLAGVTSRSVSFADINADGRPDLLAGATLYLAEGEGDGRKFKRSDLLPAKAGDKLLSAAFMEVNGDGYPDVVVSHIGGGLSIYLNPGAAGGPFIEASEKLGLRQPECGAGLTGFFGVGYWNTADHLARAIFHSGGKGALLVQDANGVFAPVKLAPVEFDFKTDDESELTGAACFAPLWRPDHMDLVASGNRQVFWVGNLNGALRDLVPYGNEIREGTESILPVICEDLNADGTVDIYAGSRIEYRNAIYGNRGYGSLTTVYSHKSDAFPGAAHTNGAWGLAAGDVDGDGANDLLLGGIDGRLVLLRNDVLASRAPKENPTWSEQVRERTRILSVQVTGRIGVIGAIVTLADDQGAVVGMRVIGSNVATGCRSPDVVNLAVRQTGAYTLKVQYADGQVWTRKVDLTGPAHVSVTSERPRP